MDFLWDTNILLHRIRRSEKYDEANRSHRFQGPGNRLFLSVINIGEIESLACQRNWGQAKWSETTDQDFDHLDGAFIRLLKV